MTTPDDAELVVRAWLHDELDAVAMPDLAVHRAITSLGAVPQRRHRWAVLRRPRRPRRPVTAGSPEPEIIMTASPSAPDDLPRMPRRSAPPSSVSVAVAAAVLCLVASAAVVGIATSGRWSLPGASLSGAGVLQPSQRPALQLDTSAGGIRDIVVDASGSGHFWTVAAALEAARDGDVIHIEPGIYRESLVVTKDVTLVGAGGPGTVVLAPAPVVTGGEPGLAPIVDGARSIPDGFAMLGLRPADPAFDADLLELGWRYVLYLDRSDASISDLTIEGSEIGTAVIIRGGAPTLSRLVIDPAGEQRNKTPSAPHEAVAIGGGSTASLRDSTLAAFVSIGEASRPTITSNVFEGSCILVGGPGSEPDIRDNRIEDSQCTPHSVWVLDGAAPTITSNVIVGDHTTGGVRVNGEGSAPSIQGNTIAGGDVGIWMGGGAGGLVQRNHVSGARTGIAVVDAHPTISVNDVVGNGIGIAIEGASRPDLVANTVCDNEQDLDIRDGEFSASSALVDCDTRDAGA